jgi:predicted nucleic acid-binding protein
VAVLLSLIRDPYHVYLKALPQPADPKISGCFERILGYQQVTDAYLLRLAARTGATLVTFDFRLVNLADATRVELLGVS